MDVCSRLFALGYWQGVHLKSRFMYLKMVKLKLCGAVNAVEVFDKHFHRTEVDVGGHKSGPPRGESRGPGRKSL